MKLGDLPGRLADGPQAAHRDEQVGLAVGHEEGAVADVRQWGPR